MINNELRVVKGSFKDNIIVTNDGNEVECVAYKPIRIEIDNHEGYFHLKWSTSLDCWIIFQAVIVNHDEFEKIVG